MRLTLAALLLAACVLAAHAGPAAACSCVGVGDPRRALEGADAAIVGVLVDKRLKSPPLRSSGDIAVYTFRVVDAVKGEFGETVEVESAHSGATCGIEAREGVPVGLLLRRAGGVWQSSLCSQIEPARLREAARPLPRPDGSGDALLVVGGAVGPARLLALDRRGRTLAYGYGEGTALALSACPGGRRLAEVFGDEDTTRVAVRSLPRLRILRELRLPFAQVTPASAGR